jgi:hypothetical protein
MDCVLPLDMTLGLLKNSSKLNGMRQVLLGLNVVSRKTCWLLIGVSFLWTGNKLLPASRYSRTMSGILKLLAKKTATEMLVHDVERNVV